MFFFFLSYSEILYVWIYTYKHIYTVYIDGWMTDRQIDKLQVKKNIEISLFCIEKILDRDT